MYRITANMPDLNEESHNSTRFWHPRMQISRKSNASEMNSHWMSRPLKQEQSISFEARFPNLSWIKHSLTLRKTYSEIQCPDHQGELSSDQVSSSSVPDREERSQFKVPFPPSHLSSYHQVQRFLPRPKHFYTTPEAGVNILTKYTAGKWDSFLSIFCSMRAFFDP